MSFSTEYFVLAIFFVATVLLWEPLRASDLGGRLFFYLALLSYLLSNFFTVAEEWIYPKLLNSLEHFFILVGSGFILIGIMKSIREWKKK